MADLVVRGQNRTMWHAETECLASGSKCRLLDDETPLSFHELIQLLEHDDDFAAWYTRLLADASFEAFYWEHPPLTFESLDRDAEFVLLDAPALATIQAEPAPFQSIFSDHPNEDVIVFPNLGGDAMLIAPSPLAANDAYPHLAAFLRRAPADQIRSLWKHTAKTVHQHVASSPKWLSTAGLGIAWLHVRLDTRPKYYHHDSYTHHKKSKKKVSKKEKKCQVYLTNK